MKLSIFAVSALVLSTSFAAVGWADGHPTLGEVTNPGAGGDAMSDPSSEKQWAAGGSPNTVLVVSANIEGTSASDRTTSGFEPDNETCAGC
jgi:hypothetical protein